MERPIVAVFGSSTSQPGDADYEDAVRLGHGLASAGYAVTNGGYAGLMEAVSRGAAEANGSIIGVTVPSLFPNRSGANGYVTNEVVASSLTVAATRSSAWLSGIVNLSKDPLRSSPAPRTDI